MYTLAQMSGATGAGSVDSCAANTVGAAADPVRAEKIRVVYIAGAGKSGSTLVDRILGSSPNAFSVGQLEGLCFFIDEHDPRRKKEAAFLDDQGHRLRDSPFWKPVVEVAEQNRRALYDPRCPLSVRNLIPALLFGTSSPYLPHFEDAALYGAVLARARQMKSPGVDTIVDSSKDMKRLIALRMEKSLDVFVLHLIRDVRGVAYSWEKKKGSWLHALRRWLILNTLLAVYLRMAMPRDHYMRMSYDLFTRDPPEGIRRLNRAFGLRLDPDKFLDAVNADTSWRFSGDGMRREPVTAIRADPAWRSKLPRMKRWVLAFVACIPNYLWVYRRMTA